MADKINPEHYKVGGIETWDYLKAKMSPTKLAGFALGNVLKYVTRADHKNKLEDLKKAKWYLDKIIEEMEPRGAVCRIMAPADEAPKKGIYLLAAADSLTKEFEGYSLSGGQIHVHIDIADIAGPYANIFTDETGDRTLRNPVLMTYEGCHPAIYTSTEVCGIRVLDSSFTPLASILRGRKDVE